MDKRKPREVRDKTHFIREWRDYRQMTVAELASLSGVSGSMVSQLETYKTTWTETTLTKLAKPLRCQPWQLIASGPVENQLLWETVLSVAVPSTNMKDMTDMDRTCLTEMVQNNCEAAIKSHQWVQLRRNGWLALDTDEV